MEEKETKIFSEWVRKFHNAEKNRINATKNPIVILYADDIDLAIEKRILMKTLDLQGAARFLHLSAEELRRRAKAGLIPGAKPGKCWVFLEEDLVEYFRQLYSGERQAMSSPRQETKSCFTNAVKLGGFVSPHQTASVLDARLKQMTGSRRKNSTIGSNQKHGDKPN